MPLNSHLKRVLLTLNSKQIYRLYSGSQKSEICPMPYALCPMPYALCPMPYALCPMPYALCPVVPHLSEKGYKSFTLISPVPCPFLPFSPLQKTRQNEQEPQQFSPVRHPQIDISPIQSSQFLLPLSFSKREF